MQRASGSPAVLATRGMDEIEAATGQFRPVGVVDHERDVRRRLSPRILDEHGIGIETHNVPRGTDARAQQASDSARAAAEIEAAPAGPDADPLQHDGAVGRYGCSLDVQPLDLARTTFDRIVAGLCHCSPKKFPLLPS